MNNGFIGFNPEDAKKSINFVEQASQALVDQFAYYNNFFLFQISNNWFAPNAVEFGKYYPSYLKSAEEDLKTILEMIYVKIVNAYNGLAQGNGYPQYYGELNITIPAVEDELQPKFREMDDDGTVGMSPTVKAWVIDYKDHLTKFFEQLDSLSVSIAFYDQNGSLLDLYNNLINNAKTTITQKVTECVKVIDPTIEGEFSSLNQATKNAAAALEN